MRDQQSYLQAAARLEELALDLASQGIEAVVAIEELLDETKGDVAALRRAHRHVEQGLMESWPGPVTPTRAFFLLSAARRRLELKPA